MKTISLLLFSMILACTGGSNNDAVSEPMAHSALKAHDELAINPAEPSAVVEAKIIKTGFLRFETQKLEQTQSQIKHWVAQFNGFVSSEMEGKAHQEEYINVTLRVPSQNFDKLIDSIAQGVAFFDQKEINQRDVTEEFIDVEARLNAKKALETRYIELLSQARNVSEILEIERELNKVRQEIESTEGRLNYLKNQVSYSTLNIYFYKRTTDRGITSSFGQKIKLAFQSGWNNSMLFLLALLRIWPFILVSVLIALGYKRYVKKRKNGM